MAEIEKAILSSDLGITPSNDGNMIRLKVPELTEERRVEMRLAEFKPKVMGGFVRNKLINDVVFLFQVLYLNNFFSKFLDLLIVHFFR